MDEKVNLLYSYIKECKNIVFFGGAGVSTESGIPDFRSVDGLYNQVYSFPPEKILSFSFFSIQPFIFFDFYRDKMDMRNRKPNFTHHFLAYLEKCGKLSTIITQNIDGLHQKAGSKHVLELHGSIYNNYCTKCGKWYEANVVFDSKNLPSCTCGGIIKPDVVLYEEPLDTSILEKAKEEIKRADLCIVGGTSLSVFPANTLLQYFHGKYFVIINQNDTDFDERADLVIHHKIGDVFRLLSEKGV